MQIGSVSMRPYLYNTNAISHKSMNKIDAIGDDVTKSKLDVSLYSFLLTQKGQAFLQSYGTNIVTVGPILGNSFITIPSVEAQGFQCVFIFVDYSIRTSVCK